MVNLLIEFITYSIGCLRVCPVLWNINFPTSQKDTKVSTKHIVAVKDFDNIHPLSLNQRRVAWVSPRTVHGAANLQQQMARGGNADHGTKADTSPLSPCQSCTAELGGLSLLLITSHSVLSLPLEPRKHSAFSQSFSPRFPCGSSLSAEELAIIVFCPGRFSSCAHLTIAGFISNSVPLLLVTSSSIHWHICTHKFMLCYCVVWICILVLMNSERFFIPGILTQNCWTESVQA